MMACPLVVACLAATLVPSLADRGGLSSRNQEMSQLLDYLVSDEEDENGVIRYDKTLRPNFGGSPVKVGITMNIDSLGPIDEVDMKFRADISFRQYWYDSRLNFSSMLPAGGLSTLTLSHEFLNKIWVPDTYFPESLESARHEVMVPNVLVRLSPDGFLLYSSRVTVVAKCPMNLEMFPLDTQTCVLPLECYGYTADQLYLYWLKQQASVKHGEIILAQFSFQDFQLERLDLRFSTGNFTQLQVKFVFKRELLYFILQSYVPSTFIVMCSWVAFWINRDGIPGRACLSITTVLSLITLIGSTNAKLPNVSTVKALDVYFGICFVYVFGGLLEFATVIHLSHIEKATAAKLKARKEKAEAYLKMVAPQREMAVLSELETSFRTEMTHRKISSATRTVSEHALAIFDEYKLMQSQRSLVQAAEPENKKRSLRQLLTASVIEQYSRVLFPSSFVVLQFVYWIYYGLKSYGPE